MAELSVRVQPRAKKRALETTTAGLKVYTPALPVDSAANEDVIRLIAEFLSVPQRHVSIKRGHSSRSKTLEITGLTQEELNMKLGKLF